MKLGFVYLPVKDLKESLAFWRALGFEEKWREGEEAAGLTIEGTDVGIMLDVDDREYPAGPFFVVDDVVVFHEANAGTLKFVIEPRDIPPGRYAAFEDPSGNVIRIMDTSADRA
jgi:catechol 2,3-dioxygenase-like lactoylglutathione lyase family enzyme